MKEDKLVKIMDEGELFRCTSEQRVIINGERAGVIFPGEGNVAVFIRVDPNGNVLELTSEGSELTYTPTGINIKDTWHRSGFYDTQRDLLKEMGVID